MNTTLRPPQTSVLIGACEAAWACIQAHHPDVPNTLVIVAPAERRSRGGFIKLGHFADNRWTTQTATDEPAHETLLVAEHLNRPATDVFQTLLHEATHALATARAVKDTSRGNRYHNRRFLTLALELGLAAPEHPDPIHGYSFVTLPESTAAEYGAEIGRLSAVLTAYRREPFRPAAAAAPGQEPAVCACPTPRRLRISNRELAAAPILCGVCEKPFLRLST